MKIHRMLLPCLLAAGLLVAPPLPAQGPGSCGIHLDVIADQTSTHGAVADAPIAPGSGGFLYPPGAPGNPYQAYATPGSTVKLRLSVPAGTLGPMPFGSGSTVSIAYSLGTPFIPLFPVPPGFIPPCNPGEPLVLTVLPFGGTLVDGVGLLTFPPPATPPADPGHPYEFEVDVLFPPLPVAVPVQFQAVILTPTGLIGVSNGVNLLPGPSPHETTLLPAMIPCGAFPVLDEGFAPIPTPPGFFFYGVPQPMAQVNTNPFVEFMPFGVPPCDFIGTPGDLGCPPATVNASPRVTVNHYDADWGIPAPFARVSDVTLEVAPPIVPNMPTRHIIRWKHGVEIASPSFPDASHASQVCELWGDDVPNIPVPVPNGQELVNGTSRIVVVRQDINALGTVVPGSTHAMVGIGPGPGVGPCTPLPFWTLFGGPPYVTAPLEAVFMDITSLGPFYPVDSHTQTNLALVIDPPFFGPPATYVIQDY